MLGSFELGLGTDVDKRHGAHVPRFFELGLDARDEPIALFSLVVREECDEAFGREVVFFFLGHKNVLRGTLAHRGTRWDFVRALRHPQNINADEPQYTGRFDSDDEDIFKAGHGRGLGKVGGLSGLKYAVLHAYRACASRLHRALSNPTGFICHPPRVVVFRLPRGRTLGASPKRVLMGPLYPTAELLTHDQRQKANDWMKGHDGQS